MSSIIIIKKFKEFCSYFKTSNDIDLDLIIRSILGCVYTVKRSDSKDIKKINGIKNCFIRLLNSPTVDVDKLDYIARDNTMSGYNNIILDTDRLLDGVCFIIEKDDIYFPAFKKSVLSVINNVILAKNSQAQWIINHPIVLYDAYLLHRAIFVSIKNIYDTKYSNSKNNKIHSFDELLKFIFSSKSLSKEGNILDKDFKISLLSDIELLNWMKENISDKYISEYFSRNERKKPIWKSHEEYLYFLDTDVEKATLVANFIAPLISFLKNTESKEINKELYDTIKTENNIIEKDNLLNIIDVLISYENKNKPAIDLSYIILPARNNFFTKINPKQIYISFGENDFTYYNKLKEESVTNNNKKYEFFYIYANEKIQAKHFLDYLYNNAHNSENIRM